MDWLKSSNPKICLRIDEKRSGYTFVRTLGRIHDEPVKLYENEKAPPERRYLVNIKPLEDGQATGDQGIFCRTVWEADNALHDYARKHRYGVTTYAIFQNEEKNSKWKYRGNVLMRK